MFNQQFIRKASWLVSTSTIGLTLAACVHAGEVRQLATAQTGSVISQMKDKQAKLSSLQVSAEEMLQRGLRLKQRAKTPKQHVRAFEYLTYAANQGLPEAQFQCAIMYLDDRFVPGDEERAMFLLEQAWQQGHKQAGIALDYIRAGDDGFGC